SPLAPCIWCQLFPTCSGEEEVRSDELVQHQSKYRAGAVVKEGSIPGCPAIRDILAYLCARAWYRPQPADRLGANHCRLEAAGPDPGHPPAAAPLSEHLSPYRPHLFEMQERSGRQEPGRLLGVSRPPRLVERLQTVDAVEQFLETYVAHSEREIVDFLLDQLLHLGFFPHLRPHLHPLRAGGQDFFYELRLQLLHTIPKHLELDLRQNQGRIILFNNLCQI